MCSPRSKFKTSRLSHRSYIHVDDNFFPPKTLHLTSGLQITNSLSQIYFEVAPLHHGWRQIILSAPSLHLLTSFLPHNPLAFDVWRTFLSTHTTPVDRQREVCNHPKTALDKKMFLNCLVPFEISFPHSERRAFIMMSR
ncbi:hypothetical protein CDAR_458031 [Caerostris darwini]|uniref:Maturase K n=1 Tax=Caerostris darwini TaxID=1538125 RepID=A0AAV4US79_9ARAC|nr:hypothetical protein CDAR_458031 [Caerostris darwini]